MPGRRRDHYAGSYQREAAKVRAAANANPNTRCASPTCKYGNGTIAEHPPGSTWDAGHVHDGIPGSPLQPEVSCCNRGAGARIGNARRRGLEPTRDW